MVLSTTLLAGEIITTGGLAENKLKKLKGLKLTLPFLSIVDAKHAGLGAMACCK